MSETQKHSEEAVSSEVRCERTGEVFHVVKCGDMILTGAGVEAIQDKINGETLSPDTDK